MKKSAEQLAQAIRDKKCSSVEVAQAFIAQIERVNPDINAVAQVDPQRIIEQAKQCDAALQQGQLRGALHGVPVTIKDNLLTQDIITTGGSAAFAKHKPTADATAVKRLRDAGAIILGKSNLPDFALAWETESTAYGRTNNPHDLNYTAGGSSGGEAAIIAAGGSPLGLGTDSGGSIRLPAHYCGIAGLRTSHGLIPSTGHMPPAEGYPILGVFAPFNAIGPMARSVSDLLYVLPVLTGRDSIDPYAEYDALQRPQVFTLKGLRVAFYTSACGQSIDPEIEQALNKIARLLEQEGALIDAVEPPALSEARDIYCNIAGADGGEGIKALLSELHYPQIPQNLINTLKLMPKEPSVRMLLDAQLQRDFFRIKQLQFMQKYDLILCPVAAHTALAHGLSFSEPERFAQDHYLIPYSVLGWPSVVIPVGIARNHLPIGAQIIAKHRQDYCALYTAQAIERLLSTEVNAANKNI